MVRRSGKDGIYHVAEMFRQRCLVGQQSLLWPDVAAWTPEFLSLIWEATIENRDTSDRGFFEKLEDQLRDLPEEVYRIASDVTALYYLYPTNYRPSTKMLKVAKVMRWKLQQEPTDQSVKAAYSDRGIGHPGTYYSTGRDLQFGFYHRFAEELHRQDADPYSFDECKEVALAVEKQLPQRAVAARHILLHLLFPDQTERIASENHRRKILSTYEELAGDYSDSQEGLSNVRRALVEQTGREGLDFYDKDIRVRWDPSVGEEDETREDAESESEEDAPSFWVEKTLVDGRPHREEGEFALGKVLWSPQRDERGADIYRFMREVEPGDVVLHLTDNEAFTGVSRAATACEDFEGVENSEWGYGDSYLVRLEDFNVLEPPLPRSVFFGDPHKERLLRIRDRESNLFYTSGLELRKGAYLTPAPDGLVEVLNDAYESVSGEPLTTRIPQLHVDVGGGRNGSGATTLDWLEARTLWPRSRLIELVDDLRQYSPQVVLAGPPGTSKTWVAKHVARYLTDDRRGRYRIVQFHPSYGYEDFIEGLRPVSKDGTISFDEQPGVLLQMAREMRNRGAEDETHVLVIDEMNRANLPRVFGELMYLFEYRGGGEEIQLQYTDSFSLPPGLRFIGTMNTADRSIRSIDIALRRRFDVFECEPEPEILERFYGRDQNTNEVEDLIDGFERLNDQLREHLDRHHLVGHTFFMARRMDWERLEKVWRRKIGPLIEEYFFDQPDVAEEYALEAFWSTP